MKKNIFRSAGGVLAITVLMLGGVVAAQTYTDPSGTPQAANTEAPLNVGAGTQTKSGNFWFASIGTDTGYCLGGSCITAWPTPAVPACAIERREVTRVSAGQYYGTLCEDSLSAASRTAGWGVAGSDSCTEDNNWCTIDSGGLTCSYVRTVCNGVGVTSSASRMTSAQAVSAGFIQ